MKIFCQVSSACGSGAGDKLRWLAEGMTGIGHELGRHLGRRQLIVHQTGGDGAARHAIIFGRFRGLDHDHAAFALDGPNAQGAIAAGAGEDDADRPLMLILGKRAEEKIDRQPLTARSGRFQQTAGRRSGRPCPGSAE